MITWRQVYPYLAGLKNKDHCLVVCLDCFEKTKEFLTDEFLLETGVLLQRGEVPSDRLQRVAQIRVNTEEPRAREAAHVLLHFIEAARAVNAVSAAGHTARCVEAISKIGLVAEL